MRVIASTGTSSADMASLGIPIPDHVRSPLRTSTSTSDVCLVAPGIRRTSDVST